MPIGGGETACVGEIVVTRRNDRTLTTSTGDTVRNRDMWTVTATHANGDLTVTPQTGHGTVRLPADYVREYVRLGYAATEHGNQGTTVDIAYQLVSCTTTSRGLYVGATRGRDRNQFLVVTDTNDPADARDLLDRVLTFDRADAPAVVQRRRLHTLQTPAAPEPTPTWTREPDWLQPGRHRLADRRAEIVDERRAGLELGRRAAQQLVEIQPRLAAARQAWQPYQDRIDALEDTIHNELRSAMWKANSEASRAGFGHRHRTARHARDTNQVVYDTEALIRAIHHEGRTVKDHLDHLHTTATRLQDRAAGPSPLLTHLTDQQLAGIERLIDTIDTWTQWNTGNSTTTRHLLDTIETLTVQARHAPPSRFATTTSPAPNSASSPNHSSTGSPKAASTRRHAPSSVTSTAAATSAATCDPQSVA